MTTKVKVTKHELDDKASKYRVYLAGQSPDIIDGVMVDVEVRIKSRTADIAGEFPRGATFSVELEAITDQK